MALILAPYKIATMTINPKDRIPYIWRTLRFDFVQGSAPFENILEGNVRYHG